MSSLLPILRALELPAETDTSAAEAGRGALPQHPSAERDTLETNPCPPRVPSGIHCELAPPSEKGERPVFTCAHSPALMDAELRRVAEGVRNAVECGGRRYLLLGEDHGSHAAPTVMWQMLHRLNQEGWPAGLPKKLMLESDSVFQEHIDTLSDLARTHGPDLAGFVAAATEYERHRPDIVSAGEHRRTNNILNWPTKTEFEHNLLMLWSMVQMGFEIQCVDNFDTTDDITRDEHMQTFGPGVYYLGASHAGREGVIDPFLAESADIVEGAVLADLLGDQAHTILLYSKRFLDGFEAELGTFDDWLRYH